MRYGKFGGMYIPELLITPLKELEDEWNQIKSDPDFFNELFHVLHTYAGRPTPVTEVVRLSQAIGGPRIFLKREDLLHTGAHKLNNSLGQCLLAKRLGKESVIAETGAGQHGVATATACARLGLKCRVYMGSLDIERQKPNVRRMELLGAEVIGVDAGQGTLKDAVNEALRDYASSFDTSHYCLGSVVGPHPYPEMVEMFQSIIGKEAKEYFLHELGVLPDQVVACVGGGSNAIGIFSAFLEEDVKLIGVEGGGKSQKPGGHAASLQGGKPGILHGFYSYLLQDENGNLAKTHSISAGLDYPSVGPHHAHLYETGRSTYTSIRDEEALQAMKLLSQYEGIIPALESAHALAYVIKIAPSLPKDALVLVNLSGRGDKDMERMDV